MSSFLLAILSIGTLFLLISATYGDEGCQQSIDWARKAADPLSDFTVQLYNAISIKNPEQNLIFSPASISLSLAVLKAGADGDTRWQMRYVLVKRGSNDSDARNIYQALQKQLQISAEKQPDDVIRLSVVNGLYHKPQVTLKPEYLTLARDCFRATVDKCNFQGDASGCRSRINEWVSTNTNQKIPNLFQEDSINRDTAAILANAIYFKAPWYETFPEHMMSTGPFYRFGREDDEQSVQYLSNEDQYLYSQTTTVSIVGIPYKGNDFFMYVILPKKRDGLEEMERTFTGTELMFLINRTTVMEVEVKIPKFKVKTRVDLKPILISLGLKDMFSNSANFKRMTDSAVYVDAAAHEAFIDVSQSSMDNDIRLTDALLGERKRNRSCWSHRTRDSTHVCATDTDSVYR